MAYLLHHLLRGAVERFPHKAAVWAADRALTYEELDAWSSRLAHFLRDRGLRKGDRVGICFPKAVESVVAMLGVLKAGGVYVPLDPHAPAQRIGRIIANCGMRAVIARRANALTLERSALDTLGVIVTTDEDSGSSLEGRPVLPWSTLSTYPVTAHAWPDAIETDLAYILYTSGSTGVPKGVMLSHRNALTFVDWCAHTFRIRTEDRLSNHAPLHFDLSVFDIYNTLEAGATVFMIDGQLAIFPAAVASFIERHHLSVWYSVPSALVSLVLRGALSSRNLENLRLILFAGEVFPMKHLRELARLVPHAALANLYGPTETNVCTWYPVDRAHLDRQDSVPIGKACANTETFAVREDGEPIGPGEEGELYVRGPSVTPGYWADPEKTQRTVSTNPFEPYLGDRVYRTGDIVKLEADGNYVFVGRRDEMVKSRGYRIELGEIEAALYSHPAVIDAAVVPVPDTEIGCRIKAFVVTNSPSVTPRDLQTHCAQRVPAYMVPEFVEHCDALPTTTTGKVDRKALKELAASGGPTA